MARIRLSHLVALAGAALLAGAAPAASRPGAAAPGVRISELAPGRFELVYSGTQFTSRDRIEQSLLLSAARLALAHGQQWFVLLPMPGEHPVRSTASFGSRYGHWQPHWTYYLPEHGWQPWHPEWEAPFWTRDVDPGEVKRFQAHAMIALGRSADPGDATLLFDAKAVVHDLEQDFGSGAPRARPGGSPAPASRRH